MSKDRYVSEYVAWRERWIAGVLEGLEAADRGDFASEEEIAIVLNKCRRAKC